MELKHYNVAEKFCDFDELASNIGKMSDAELDAILREDDFLDNWHIEDGDLKPKNVIEFDKFEFLGTEKNGQVKEKNEAYETAVNSKIFDVPIKDNHNKKGRKLKKVKKVDWSHIISGINIKKHGEAAHRNPIAKATANLSASSDSPPDANHNANAYNQIYEPKQKPKFLKTPSKFVPDWHGAKTNSSHLLNDNSNNNEDKLVNLSFVNNSDSMELSKTLQKHKESKFQTFEKHEGNVSKTDLAPPSPTHTKGKRKPIRIVIENL